MNFSLDFISPSDCETKDDFDTIESAFNFAQTAHKDHKRKSGEPYFLHLYAVAKVTWEKYRNVTLTAAAFLHDTLEDCEKVERADIYNTFGDEIGFLVDAVSKCYLDFYKLDNKFDDKTVRILWAGSRDIRVLLLKLADREHNLSTVKFLPSDKQIRMSFETQAIYEPLKNILSYDSPVSLSETSRRRAAFVARHKLHTPLEFKEYLFRETFENIDNDLYPMIYENTDSVIWKVDGVKMFDFLCNSDIFKDRIEFTLITASCEEDVEAYFKFKIGVVAKDEDIKMNLSSYKTN